MPGTENLKSKEKLKTIVRGVEQAGYSVVVFVFVVAVVVVEASSRQ
jgi:hypothetical protein